MPRIRLIVGFLIAVLLTGRAPLVLAQRDRAVGATPPRLAFVDGEVSFWRPGADDWVAAQINTPLAAGDELYVGEGGNVEVQIGGRGYVRGGSGTRIALDSLETRERAILYVSVALAFFAFAAVTRMFHAGGLGGVSRPPGAAPRAGSAGRLRPATAPG